MTLPRPFNRLLLACAAAAAACGDASEAPSSDLNIIVVRAPDVGTPGIDIPGGVVLQVVDGDGTARQGIEVRLSATGGGTVEPASAETGADGLVAVTWQLGLAVGQQVLSARVLDLPATQVTVDALAFRVSAITAGWRTACGIAEGEVWCWGRSDMFDVLESNTRPARAMPGREVTAIALGGDGLCALDVDGRTWCRRRFPTGPEEEVPGLPPLASISVGTSYFCGIAAADRTSWCWSLGQPSGLRQVSASLSFATVTAGGGPPFACGLDLSGISWCWGEGAQGQLGDGLAAASEAPVRVAGGYRFVQIEAGGAHACGVLPGATLYCWGDSTRLGLPRPTRLVPAPAGIGGVQVSLGDYGGMVTAGAATTIWGASLAYYGTPQFVLQSLPGLATLAFRDIAAGEHACAIAGDGTAWCTWDVFYDFDYRGPIWVPVPHPDAPPFDTPG